MPSIESLYTQKDKGIFTEPVFNINHSSTFYDSECGTNHKREDPKLEGKNPQQEKSATVQEMMESLISDRENAVVDGEVDGEETKKMISKEAERNDKNKENVWLGGNDKLHPVGDNEGGGDIEDCETSMKMFCPNFDFEKNKKRKRELAKHFESKVPHQSKFTSENEEAPPQRGGIDIVHIDKEVDCQRVEAAREAVEQTDDEVKSDLTEQGGSFLPLRDDELNLHFESLSLNRKNSSDENNDLKSRGPEQTNFQAILGIDQQGSFPPDFDIFPGQPRQPAAIPASNYSGMHHLLMDDANYNLHGAMSTPWPAADNSYPQVSHYPSQPLAQSMHTFDYNVGQVSPHNDFSGIPTVIVKGGQVTLPGDSLRDDKMIAVINGWENDVIQNQVQSGNGSTREYVESSWPSSPYSPPPDNPPSVQSSDGSLFDAGSPYSAALSPSGSTESTVNSPLLPTANQPELMQSQEHSYTVRPNNTNFGTVRASCCSSQSSTNAAVSEIVKYLKKDETEINSSSSLPGINTILSSKNTRHAPYPQRTIQAPAVSMSYSQPQQLDLISIQRTPLQVPERAKDIEVPRRSSPTSQGWEAKAQMLLPAHLSKRDCEDPFEGEDLLQKLILNQQEKEAIAIIQRMYHLKMSLNGVNKKRQSAVLLAVINNMPQVVRCLVSHGADFMAGDSRGTYPIHYAASHRFTDVMHAIYYSCNQQINWDHLNFDGKSALMCAVEVHKTYQTFFDTGHEEMRMVDNLVMAEVLLQYGANVAVQDIRSGKTALHYAITDYKFTMMQVLLNDQLGVVCIPMSDGNTPLHLAVGLRCDQETKCSIVNYLIHKGADITATNAANNKVSEVVTAGHKEVSKLLDKYSGKGKRAKPQTSH